MAWGKIGDWISGIVDRGRDDYWRDRNENFQDDASRKSYERQKEFAQMGIRWKVDDAVAAGLHPLYALGGATSSFSPSPVSIGDGAHSAPTGGSGQLYETSQQREFRAKELEALQARIDVDYATRARIESETAMNYQRMNGGPRTLDVMGDDGGLGGLGGGSSVTIPSNQQFSPGNVGMVQLSGDPSPSVAPQRQDLGAAVKPFWTEYSVAPNLRMMLPWTQEGPGEALENIAWWMWPGILSRNAGEYGAGWLRRFYKEAVLGQSVEFRQMPSVAREVIKEYLDNSQVAPLDLKKSGRERGVNWRSNRQYFFGR